MFAPEYKEVVIKQIAEALQKVVTKGIITFKHTRPRSSVAAYPAMIHEASVPNI